MARLARLTEGYSGSDIVLVCKEAAMRPVRRLMTRLEAMEVRWLESHAPFMVNLDV